MTLAALAAGSGQIAGAQSGLGLAKDSNVHWSAHLDRLFVEMACDRPCALSSTAVIYSRGKVLYDGGERSNNQPQTEETTGDYARLIPQRVAERLRRDYHRGYTIRGTLTVSGVGSDGSTASVQMDLPTLDLRERDAARAPFLGLTSQGHRLSLRASKGRTRISRFRMTVNDEAWPELIRKRAIMAPFGSRDIANYPVEDGRFDGSDGWYGLPHGSLGAIEGCHGSCADGGSPVDGLLIEAVFIGRGDNRARGCATAYSNRAETPDFIDRDPVTRAPLTLVAFEARRVGHGEPSRERLRVLERYCERKFPGYLELRERQQEILEDESGRRGR